MTVAADVKMGSEEQKPLRLGTAIEAREWCKREQHAVVKVYARVHVKRDLPPVNAVHFRLAVDTAYRPSLEIAVLVALAIGSVLRPSYCEASRKRSGTWNAARGLQRWRSVPVVGCQHFCLPSKAC